MATTDNPSAGWRMKVAVFALAAAVFTVLWFAVAALGTKFGLWPWQVGLGQMTIGTGPMIAMLAVGLGLVAQVIALIKFPRKQAFIVALAATLIAAMCLFRVAGFGGTALSLPPIHDVQTDWSDPVRFSETMMQARATTPGVNAVEDAPVIPAGADARWPGLGGRLVSQVQAEAMAKPAGKGMVYPQLIPLYFSGSPVEIAALAEALMVKQGWTLVTPAPTGEDDGTEILVEGTSTSAMFGFKDDVAIRIRPVEGATRVDIRSTSRVGLSDLGANAKRIDGLLTQLRERGNGRPTPN